MYKYKSFLSDKIPIIINIAVFCLIVYLSYCFSQYHTVILDDLYQIFIDKDKSIFNQFILDVYHGRYIGNFLTKFTGSVLPFCFGIQVNIWANTYGAVIKGIFLAIFCFTIANFSCIFSKNKFIVPFLAVIIYLFYQYNFIGKYPDFLYTSFYGFTFPFIFFLIFLYYLINYLFLIKNINFKMLYLFAFLTGISTEFTSITLFIILLLLITCKRLFDSDLKPIYISFVFLSTGILLYFINPGLIRLAMEKGTFQYNFIEELPQFLNGFCSVFYTEFIKYLIIILCLMLVINYFSEKVIKNKILLFSAILLISGFCFYFLLIFTGRTNFKEYSLYVYHLDLIMQMKIYLIMNIFLLFGVIAKRGTVFIVTLAVILLYLLSAFNTLNVINEQWYINRYLLKHGIKTYAYERQGKFYKNLYSQRYLLERIYAFFAYKNIPVTIMENDSYDLPSSYFPYSDVYIKAVYGNSPEIINKTNNLDELYNIYIKNGGCEINKTDIEKTDFQQLLNKDYVLICK